MGFEIVPPRAPIADKGGFITPEWFRFLVQVQRMTGSGLIEELQSAEYLTYTPAAALTNAKTLLAGTALSLVPAASTVEINLDDTSVTPGTYGSSTQLVSVAVDQQGRITLAQSYTLDSDNVTEGATNLFFTNARARAALSGGTGISYNSGTGVIAVATNGVGDSQLRQSAAFSVIGRAGNTTGDVADITAANDGEVLRRSGSVLGFGAIDLSSANGVAGILSAARGGSGFGSYTAGDMLYATGATTLAKLAIGTNNYVLTSNGSAPVWTANTGTGNVVRATSPTIDNPTNTATTTINNTPSSEWGIDFAGPGLSTTVTIADGATYDLATGSGMVFIWDNALGAAAQIACWFGSTSIVWQSGTTFTITSGTASKINVFYNGGTGKYRIQNNSGGSVTLFLGMIRMRASS